MKLCGLTGGVGMGKSTAASFLSQNGVQIIDTDDIARELTAPGQPALEEIREGFGSVVFQADGSLNRAELARIVFGSLPAREQLQAILHPRIRERWLAKAEQWRRDAVPVGIVVIPLLFETQAEHYFSKIICVACSAGQQQGRLRQRGWTSDQIKRRQSAQMAIDKKMAQSHYVVWTEGELTVSHEQLTRILGAL